MRLKNLNEKHALISVIVPVYNVEKYLSRCIESILSQSYKNIELLLIEDGSTDDCWKICDEYVKKDTRVHVIHQENKGLSEARNTGLTICKGQYITFIDSDDYIDIDYIEHLYKEIDDCDYVSSGYTRVNQSEEILYDIKTNSKIILSGIETLSQYYKGSNDDIKVNSVHVWGKLYKSDLWNEVKFPRGMMFEDIFVMPYILLNCKKIKFIPETGYYYREISTSIMNKKSKSHADKLFQDSFKIWDKHLELYEKNALVDFITEVRCLRVEKIMASSMAGSIPENMEMYIRTLLKKEVIFLIHQKISYLKKIKYMLFYILGPNIYNLFRNI